MEEHLLCIKLCHKFSIFNVSVFIQWNSVNQHAVLLVRHFQVEPTFYSSSELFLADDVLSYLVYFTAKIKVKPKIIFTVRYLFCCASIPRNNTYWNVPNNARKSLWNMFMSCDSIALSDDCAPGLSALLYLCQNYNIKV